jgi:hypothetical protein
MAKEARMNNLMGAGSVVPYAQEMYAQGQNAAMLKMPTMKQRLDLAVQQAEERLAAAKEAREIFERNPDIERLLDLMQRAHF